MYLQSFSSIEPHQIIYILRSKSIIFHVFSDHCSIVQAWRLKVTCFAQKCDFGPPICAPRGLQNATTGAQFSPKRPQMRGPPNYLGRLGGDLGDQRSKNSPSLRFHRFKGRFWGDFMLDFKHIWIRFRSNLSYHLWSLISIPKALLIEVFPTVYSCSDLAANNKQQVKTIM